MDVTEVCPVPEQFYLKLVGYITWLLDLSLLVFFEDDKVVSSLFALPSKRKANRVESRD